MLYTIRDYDRRRDEYHNILSLSSPPITGMPGGSNLSNPTEDGGIKLSLISDELQAVEQALLEIPPEYRQGVLNNIKYGGGYPSTAAYITWRRWKYRLAYEVAERLHCV